MIYFVILVQNCNFLQNFSSKVPFVKKIAIFSDISICDQNLDFVLEISICDQNHAFSRNFDLWPKSWFFPEISICDKNHDFFPKFRFVTKILILLRNFREISICDQKF